MVADDNSKYRIYSNYSSDGGANWNSDQDINSAESDGQLPQVVISGSNVVAVWYQPIGGFNRICCNYSSEGGAHWGHAEPINSAVDGSHPQVAIVSSDVVVVWHQSDGTHNRVYVNHSSDGGVHWDGEMYINSDEDGYNPQVAMSGTNAVAIWYGSEDSDLRTYSNYSSDGGANWGSSQAIDDNAGLHSEYEPQLAISGSNTVAVWDQHDGTGYRIYSNCSCDGGATWGGAQIIEDNEGLIGYAPQVAISGVNAVAVWYQYTNNYPRIFSNYARLMCEREPPVVGGDVYPVSKFTFLVPYLILAMVLLIASDSRFSPQS